MKCNLQILIWILFAGLFTACKETDGNDKNKKENSITETGQHIGASADSTTVDGHKGEMSNY